MSGNLDYSVLLDIMKLYKIDDDEQLEIFENINVIENVLRLERDNKNKMNDPSKSHESIKKKIEKERKS